jgi:ribonuclease HII
MAPTTEHEQALLEAGHSHIAGIDEAGRGCWAGPVVAAAVVFPSALLANPHELQGVNDSKQLSATRRAKLFGQIQRLALGWGVGAVPSHVIDTHGILNATRLAMQIALLQLPFLPNSLLIDAVTLHGWPCSQQALIKGDARCLSIAAASILAKETRDRIMVALDSAYPAYGFASHKGYGTATHEAALHTYGPTSHHRRTFRPLASFLTDGRWPASGHSDSGTIAARMIGEEEYYDNNSH